MTTSVRIINYGPLPVVVELMSHDGKLSYAQETVAPGDVSEMARYVHQGAKVVVTEVNG